MITVDIKQLASAIAEANAFELPEMSNGTQYIYDEIYSRLSRGMDVRLSEIDYDSFELDDIDSMRELYSDTLEANEYKAGSVSRALRNILPAVTTAAFV